MIPTPQSLGLPSKFVEWRKGQWQAITDGLECERKFAVQVQRAGRGKTLTLMTQAHLAKDQRVMVLTANKGLQDQMLEEWGAYGLVDIRGKSSYDCDGLPGNSCEEGGLSKCMYKGTSMCGYNDAVRKVKDARVAITNYSCWIAANKYGQGFGNFDMLICDEAHNAPGEVAKAMRVQLSDKEMESMKRDWPKHEDRGDMAVWKHWAQVGVRMVEPELQRLKLALDKPGTPSQSAVKNYKHMKNLSRKLADIATSRPERWVVDDWQYGYQFDAVQADAYAERLLFRGIEKIILTSGTIRPKTLEMLGVGHADYRFFEYESDVDVRRSPLIHLQTGVKVNVNTQPWELRKLVKWVDQIIESRHDRKGIIHTANFKLRDFIMSNSKYGSCMVSNYKGGELSTSQVIQDFKKMKAPAILVSPSVTTGYDFPYSDCRYQIIAKLPYDNIFSKIEQARLKLDKDHSAYKMMQALAQAFGRGDRGEDDWQEVFVLDDNIGHAMWRYGDLGPSWLPSYFRSVDKLPDPIQPV